MVLISIVVFPLYLSINYSYFPITVFTCDAEDSLTFIGANIDQTISTCTSQDVEIKVRVGFQVFMLSLMTFLGWFLLMIFLPTGMQAIPFDYGSQWVNRPRPMGRDEFDRSKAQLAK